MSRSSSPAVPTTFNYTPQGFTAKLNAFFVGLASFEPVVSEIYAQNAKLRATGRAWLL